MKPDLAPNCRRCVELTGEDARTVWIRGEKRSRLAHRPPCPDRDPMLRGLVQLHGLDEEPTDWRTALRPQPTTEDET